MNGIKLMHKAIFRPSRPIFVFLVAALLVSCTPPSAQKSARQETPMRTMQSAPATPQQQEAAVIRSNEEPAVTIEAPRREIIPGRGQILGPRAATTPRLGSAEGDITLNFVNADIRDATRAVLGEILSINVAVDPKVQGQMTLQTSRPVSRDAVLPIFENALRLSGFSLVRTNGIYTVVPNAEALRAGPSISQTGSALLSGYGIRVVPLRHMGAEEMTGILKSVMPPDSLIRPVPGRNILMLGGAQAEVVAMLDVVSLFDVSAMAGMSFGLFTPRYVDAKALIRELEVIFGLSVKTSGATPIRLISLDRLNAVLAMTSNQDYLNEVGDWIDRLDRSGDNVDTRVFVYYVQNGRAADLASVLNSLFTGKAQESGASSVEASRRNDGVVDGIALSGRTQGAGMSSAAVPGALGAAIPIPDRAPTADSRPTGGVTPGADAGIRLNNGVAPRIIADSITNSLLILATPREYRVVEAALGKLDIPPLQVLIEAVVAEVTLTEDLRYGVQWLFQPGRQTLTLSEASSGAVASKFPGFSTVFGGQNIRAVLDALESMTRVNVVSSPKLMVLNNQTATLQVGDQVPIATQSAVGVSSPGTPIVNSIQFRDTGVILKVTPRVNEGGLVLLDINQEVSDVAKTTTSTIDSPTIQQRKLASSISVSNGETIALGGLIRDKQNSGNSGIPLLKDVPVLGNLFRSNTQGGTRTELLVLLTPRVVRSPADIRRVTDELREKLRAAPFDKQ